MFNEKEKGPEKQIARIRTLEPVYYNCQLYPLSYITNTLIFVLLNIPNKSENATLQLSIF